MTPEDLGIHRTREDLWEEELKQAGWQSVALHPHSPTWRDPDGQLFPGPGYSCLIMKERAGETGLTTPKQGRNFMSWNYNVPYQEGFASRSDNHCAPHG